MSSDAFSAEDHQWMAHALRLAERGVMTARPNPRVGCVIVRDGECVGEGWHARTGEAHAEVHALRAAGAEARGAIVYVNLEPCSHFGRTPPCCDALLEAGVAEVVVAMRDPNPAVAGNGLERLRQGGVRVREGLLEPGALVLNAGFARRMLRRRPWVRCKLAASLDGRTAMASGESRWITGAAARADVHRWRARSCAIVTGSGTVRADDPALTVRDVTGAAEIPPPLRVVLDSGLTTPPHARLLAEPGPVLILTASEDNERRAALEAAGAEVERIASRDGVLDLEAVLELLAGRQVNEVLVESGPTLAGAFLGGGWVDEFIVYQAPHLMGHQARPLLQLPGLETMAGRRQLTLLDVRRVGDDIRIMARPEPVAGEG
ncbi:bifunctional diaminohydroxyphosphoribosylaminopyrimidine deaminase/5-amino-6-(5-phosphoribosylamino)uracil reductase RibD [Aquisalimonas sp. 2447]|uniref:bifunctional diaminohydroxyphosphoribosylaminopyrimidine deaminase/5-amino-6-(5-phosphoribosylamino)uracil reductase RibD n=1 Tax=Aquisalimonas sp. 2447 TaxID=2740807 RepID=UPI001432471B|nr:bifunctional diaminohydroxyphosphoribosylaminopyrimidine deaminase/5-amino-6-(5-phosphoribosylamino)uracil reductase RibD [Aquisalimonas sp. 2447]QIT54318.1 bifunctional diaminohydroxyphosphoribosylaminopyrimidine deaminase/5-amino-6-(5-phosphoribosylamino)uracil reductase RibD [Aquisalimonas sp. 2447]